MLQLVARYADAWNWWSWDETLEQIHDRLEPIVQRLEQACESEERDPSTLEKTLDLYTIVPEGFSGDGPQDDGLDMKQPLIGSSEAIASHILSIGELGFEEVRCDVFPKTIAAVEAMQPVVELVHAG